MSLVARGPGKPGKKTASGVDNTARRTWDKDEYRKKAEEREKEEGGSDADEITPAEAKKRRRLARDPLHQGLIVERGTLQGRQYQLDLTAKLGKTQVIGLNTPLNQQAGYYCSVCDCVLRDSQSYLDHINGKWHNRSLGMSMRVERSTLDQVKNRLEAHKQKAKDYNPEDYLPDGIDKRLVEAEQAAERERQERRERKKEKRREQDKDEDEDAAADPDMMALMGFGGFGGKK